MDDTIEKEDELAVTELTKFSATVVSGVTTPANGTPFLILKSHGSDPISEGGDQALVKAEADQIEELLTKGICGDDECAACAPVLEGVPGEVATKAKLKAKERNTIPKDQFADPEDRKLPVHDKAHAANALSRFSQTDFKSQSAKRKAARRIKSATRRFGITPSGDDDVNKQAWEDLEKAIASGGGPGVTPGSTKTPRQKGKIRRPSGISSTSVSGKVGPETKTCPKCGGKGGRVDGKPGIACSNCHGSGIIPVKQDKVRTNPLPPRVPHSTAVVTKSDDDDDDDDEGLDSDDKIVIVDGDGPAEKQKKKNSWIQGDNATPGSVTWEDFDASTLDSVASGLAAAVRAVTSIQKRERVEAINGDEVDWRDAADLANAGEHILTALGFVARLAYAERAAGSGAMKSTIRPEVVAALKTARIHLTGLLGDGSNITINQGEGSMPTEMTIDQLNGLLEKAAKRGAKLAKQRAETKVKKKSSNNNGEVTEGTVRAKGRRKITPQLKGVPKTGRGRIRKEKVKKPKADPALAALAKQVSETQDLVKAMAKRPRTGGPVLDGQARGAFPATDRSGTVTKSEVDQDIERLQKELDGELGKPGPEHAVRASDLSFQLTRERLYRHHLAEGLG